VDAEPGKCTGETGKERTETEKHSRDFVNMLGSFHLREGGAIIPSDPPTDQPWHPRYSLPTHFIIYLLDFISSLLFGLIKKILKKIHTLGWGFGEKTGRVTSVGRSVGI
jgi:hypothetical protein